MVGKKLKERCDEKKRFWQVHVRAWARSGLTQNEYCKQNKLKSSRFCYWKKKLRNHQESAVNFVPVPVHCNELQFHNSNKDSGLTLYLHHDICIKLNNNFSPATLSKVVATLGEKSK